MSDNAPDLDGIEETYATCASVNEYGRKCRGDATERYGRWNVCERCAMFLAEAERRGAPDCSVSPPPVGTSVGSPDLDAALVNFDVRGPGYSALSDQYDALIAHCRTLLARAEKAEAERNVRTVERDELAHIRAEWQRRAEAAEAKVAAAIENEREACILDLLQASSNAPATHGQRDVVRVGVDWIRARANESTRRAALALDSADGRKA